MFSSFTNKIVIKKNKYPVTIYLNKDEKELLLSLLEDGDTMTSKLRELLIPQLSVEKFRQKFLKKYR